MEQRMVPAVVFAPVFGAESIVQNNGAHLGDNPVYLVFRGPQWNSSNEAAYITAAQQLMAPTNHHFDVIQQYGSDGNLSFPGAGNTFTNNSNPATASNSIIGGTAKNVAGSVPSSPVSPIFVVVTWNLGDSDARGAGGWNSRFEHSLNVVWDGCGATWNNGSISTGNTPAPTPSGVNSFTNILSHELGEIMTDLGEGGVEVSAGASWAGGGDNQIGDHEGNSYAFTGNDGIQVQPLWSDKDKAWVASDASSQTGIILTASQSDWNFAKNTFNPVFSLTIEGDAYSQRTGQITHTTDDNVTIQTIGSNLVVNLNGEQAQFPIGSISSVNVQLAGGHNTLQVLSLPAGLTVTDSSTPYAPGANSITLGSGGSLAGIQGTVNVNVGWSGETLTLDDSADSAASFNVTSSSISYNGRTIATYTPLQSRTILGGPKGNTFDVNDATSNVPVTIKAGNGTNAIRVHALGYGSPVNVSTSSGTDNVLVGADGTLASIASPVNVSNSSGHDAITVRDDANTRADSLVVTNSSVQASGQTVATFGSADVTVNGSSGGNTIDVKGSPSNSLTVNTGGGTDYVNLHATNGPVKVYNDKGSNHVTVGADGTLTSIGGPVTIANSNSSGSTDVSIDDHKDSVAHTYVVNSAGFSGAGLPTVNLQSPIRSVSITSGSSRNAFEIDGVPPGTISIFTNYADWVYGAAASQVHRYNKSFFSF
jgi:hypothetical protein